MPVADIEGVIALAGRARRGSKILEISSGLTGRVAAGAARGHVLVVPGNGVCDRPHPAPRRIVRLQEGGVSTAVVLVIAEWKHARQALTD